MEKSLLKTSGIQTLIEQTMTEKDIEADIEKAVSTTEKVVDACQCDKASLIELCHSPNFEETITNKEKDFAKLLDILRAASLSKKISLFRACYIAKIFSLVSNKQFVLEDIFMNWDAAAGEQTSETDKEISFDSLNKELVAECTEEISSLSKTCENCLKDELVCNKDTLKKCLPILMAIAYAVNK